MQHVDVDIVLPCYNPPPGWTQQVISSITYLHQHLPGTAIGLYIVNDGSSNPLDADIAIIKASLPQLVYLTYQPNCGKGKALRTGVQATTAPLVIYTDIDFPYQMESFLELYHNLLNRKGDLVIGIRPDSYYNYVPPGRRVISKILRLFIRLFLRIPTSDTQAGIKGFNSDGKAIFLKTSIDRYLFDMEFIYMATRQKRTIYCQPVHLRAGVVFSHMNWKVLVAEGFNFLRILFFRLYSSSIIRTK